MHMTDLSNYYITIMLILPHPVPSVFVIPQSVIASPYLRLHCKVFETGTMA